MIKADNLFNDLDRVNIPNDLSETSPEESIFQTSEEIIHKDRKQAQARELFREKLHTLEIENNNLKTLSKHRVNYSWAIFSFCVIFVIVSVAILLLASLTTTTNQQPVLTIDNSVLMTLMGTNLVQIIGLLFIVAKWLFPSRTDDKNH